MIWVSIETLCPTEMTVLETEACKEGLDVLCRVVAEFPEDNSRGDHSGLCIQDECSLIR